MVTPPGTPQGPDGLQAFNAVLDALPDSGRVQLFLEICSSPVWARGMTDGAPYIDASALLDRAQRTLDTLPDEEVDAALSGHPRIGDRPGSASSAREQSGVTGAPADVLAELAAGNRAYEERFGHVYLVCANGRSAKELLTVLTERLGNDADTERAVTRAELGKINRLRLSRLLTERETS